jgi:predicted nucleic acid-binding protein
VTFLFDTDTLSELMRVAPSQALLNRVAAVPFVHQTTSSINAGELLYGALRIRDLERLRRIQELLEPLDVLPFDNDAARAYAELRAALEAQGTPIGDGDTRIAAVALTHGLTVVTRNVRHFERVPGLTVENWLV